DATQVQCRRACTTHSMRPQRDLVVEVNVGVFVSFVAGKAGPNQALCQTRHLRDTNGASIEPCSAALFRGKHFVPAWVVKDSGDPLSLVVQCNRNAEDRISMSEICRTVERINVPAKIAAGFDSAAFFPHKVVSRPQFANAGDNQL